MSVRRKRKKLFNSKSIIYITTIVMLNFMGVTYGAWNDGLNIDTSVSTGYIDPQFDLKAEMIGNKKGKLYLDLSEDGRTLNITGECYPNYNEILFIEFVNDGEDPVSLVENGTIPTKLVKITPIYEDEIVKEVKILGEDRMRLHLQTDNENKTAIIESYEDIEKLKFKKQYSFRYEVELEQLPR